MRSLHAEAFAEWLNYRLEQQKADLDLYFSGLDCGKAAAAATWLRLESYRSLIPASANAVERQLFLGDVELLLRLTAQEGCGATEESARRLPDRAFLTTTELAAWLDVSPRSLRLWAESREIPAVKIGRHWRFPRQPILEWLRKRV